MREKITALIIIVSMAAATIAFAEIAVKRSATEVSFCVPTNAIVLPDGTVSQTCPSTMQKFTLNSIDKQLNQVEVQYNSQKALWNARRAMTVNALAE